MSHYNYTASNILVYSSYRGEKLVTNVVGPKRRRKATRDVIISTVYDEVDEEEDTVLRTAPPHTLHYRQGVNFVAGGSLKPRHKTDTDDIT